MDVKVRFRFNQITGEVEIFEVTDEGIMVLSEAEHNREHDRIAADKTMIPSSVTSKSSTSPVI